MTHPSAQHGSQTVYMRESNCQGIFFFPLKKISSLGVPPKAKAFSRRRLYILFVIQPNFETVYRRGSK